MNLFDDALSEKLAATIVLSGILPAYCAARIQLASATCWLCPMNS